MTTITPTHIRPTYTAMNLTMPLPRRGRAGKRMQPNQDNGSLPTASRAQAVSEPPKTEGATGVKTSEAGEGAFILYLREIGRVPLLTAEEELALARRVRRGDRDARDHMIQANLRLVVRIARDFESFGLPLLDLISEGNIGLMTAVDRYDPTRGVRLSTYAALWIKQHMRRAIANHSRTIRVPVHVCEKLFHVNRVATKLQHILGHAPDTSELAAECGLPEATIQRVRQAILTTVSLDSGPDAENDDRSYADIVADDRVRTASEHLEEQDLQGILDSSLGLLSAREQQVLRMRFGLDGLEPHTLDDVGEVFGLTRERIRQIQATALKKLRGRMARKVGRRY